MYVDTDRSERRVFLDAQMISPSMKMNRFRDGLKANVSDQQ